MNYSIEQFLDLVAQIVPNRYLQSLLIIVVFAVLAKIVDMIMTRFLDRLLKKTKFTLDEQILEIFDRPIFVTIMLFGLALAADRLKLSQSVNFVTLGGLKTVAIFLWAMALARFLKLIIALVSRNDMPFNLNQLVQQVIELTQPKWRDQALAAGVTIRISTDLQEAPYISGNEVQLREVLTNLLFNAVKPAFNFPPGKDDEGDGCREKNEQNQKDEENGQ